LEITRTVLLRVSRAVEVLGFELLRERAIGLAGQLVDLTTEAP
jgi:hypothetical protein